MARSGSHLLLGLGPTVNLEQQAPTATGQVRQDVQRGGRSAILVDQGAEGARADIFRADEAKPVETLLIRQNHALSLLSDLAFGSGKEAADVLAVLPPQERHEHHGDSGHAGFA